MMTIRKAADRGHANHGWLDSHFTFSFADYYDPAHMGFRGLRVINDDRIEAGRGFGAHPHRDMEIITYLLDGAIAHKDSTGTGAIIRPGDVQRMTAGTGVTHSEMNASRAEDAHLLQIWINPSQKNLTPGYEQKAFSDAEKRNQLRLVASPDARDGSVKLHADVRLYAGIFEQGKTAELNLAPNRHAWLHVARGKVKIDGKEFGEGDGVAISDQQRVAIEGVDEGELLAFDLA